MDKQIALFTGLLRLADDHLILGHRLSEWCGHAPMLEEDLAMPNIALDLIGQSRALYTYAGEVEGKGRDEDALAYLRLEREYTNLLMCERDKGDFAFTMLRQLAFSLYMNAFWRVAMTSSDETIAAISAKAEKETRYHTRHTGEWVIRLGDGTEESRARMGSALEDLTPYLGEMFEDDDVVAELEGVLPNPASLRENWQREMTDILGQATLDMLDWSSQTISGGRKGLHGEEMGYLLAELQYVQRAYPNMQW